MIQRSRVYLVALMTALMIVGCGGGGSSAGSTVITDSGDEDTVKPVITVSGGTSSMTVGGTYTAPTVTAVDNVDGDISAFIIEGGDIVDPDTVGIYTVTYNVTDSSGNAAIQKTHTVVVNSLTNTAPTTPTGLTTKVISSTQIDVSWNASIDDVGVVGYYVWRNGYLTIVSGTSHSATGLLPQTQYCFKVAAYDKEGAFSAVSDEVCADTNDGSTPWITLQSGTHNELSNIVWTGDRFLVVEENFGTPTYVYSSFDNGESWSRETTSGFSFDGADEVVYGNAEYIAVEGRTIFRSVNGVNWSSVFYADGFTDIFTVAWSPTFNRYVAGGEEGYIAYSDNGSDWNVSTTSPTPNDIKEIAWLNDRFFAINSNSSGEIFTSTDGENWTRANTPSLSLSLNSIAWNGKSGAEAIYLAGGWNTVLRSFDGINWSVINTERLGSNDKIMWAGGSINLFVIVGYENHIYTSIDGETWDARLMPNESHLNQLDFKDIAWDGTALVVVGE
ncbi:MAG TPA: immunoglobulin-like domain-containing protein, partial [Sulfurovum sp.]